MTLKAHWVERSCVEDAYHSDGLWLARMSVNRFISFLEFAIFSQGYHDPSLES